MSPSFYIIRLSKKSLTKATTQGFQVRIRGKIVKGFVVKEEKRFYAYHNLCKHLPVTLDLNDNKFLTEDTDYLQCHKHGAIFKITTGYCIEGPCEGANLTKLELEEEDSELVIKVPDFFAD